MTSPVQSGLRDGAVTLLASYAASANIGLQIYRARPASLAPPVAFVDRMREVVTHTAQLALRVAQADVIVLHGLFDSGEAADQRDAFVDGFMDWYNASPFASGANTVSGVVSLEDDPRYTPDWLPPERTLSYYATVLTLEGHAG